MNCSETVIQLNLKVHLNKLECRGNTFMFDTLLVWYFAIFIVEINLSGFTTFHCCFKYELYSCGFEMTWWWVIDDKSFHFWANFPYLLGCDSPAFWLQHRFTQSLSSNLMSIFLKVKSRVNVDLLCCCASSGVSSHLSHLWLWTIWRTMCFIH